MKRAVVALAAAAFAVNAALADVSWKGLSEDRHVSGPKITAGDLRGKVVLVDCWGIHCPPCRALLPRMEKVWKSFRHKPFVLVGSHCQGRDDAAIQKLVSDNNLTYPIYQGFGLAHGEPEFSGIPFLYVVDHRGKVVYSGHGEREATAALVNAISELGVPPSLLGDVPLKKYKSLERQVAWGRNATTVIERLKSDVKRGRRQFATDAEREQADEAEAILRAMAAARKEERAEIEDLKESNPAEALKRIKTLTDTFPKDAAGYKDELPELRRRASEFEAREKAKAREQAAAEKKK